MFDLIIKNGTIFDGDGGKPYRADIGIKGEKIAFIGEIDEKEESRVIDARGRAVTPGFIDPHTHVDLSVLIAPEMEPYLKQGVTTVVTGNCGYGMAPQNKEVFYYSDMDETFLQKAGADPFDILPLFFDRKKADAATRERYGFAIDWFTFDEFNGKCEKLGIGCNMVPLIGYSAVRTAVMGRDCRRKATEAELSAMETEVEKAMRAGAFGLSSGRDPIYLPGPFADDEEMHRMLKIVARYNGIFSSHTFNRNEKGEPDRIGGYAEMFRQAEGLAVKVNVSHVHVANMAETAEEALEAARQTLDFFEREKEKGTDLTYDVIPSPTCSDFTMKSFGFYLKPLVLMEGTRAKLGERLKDEEYRRQVHEMVRSKKLPTLDEDSNQCWLPEFYIIRHKNPCYEGKYLLMCAEENKMSMLDMLLQMFSEDPDMLADLVSPKFEAAVDLLCSQPDAMPCSDGSSYNKNYSLNGNDEIGIYPNSMNLSYTVRYLLRYGKENDAKFADAVRKMSASVADRFGIKQRGRIKAGYYADINILNREKLYSFDEEENPLKDPLGIECVIVNGKEALSDGILKPGNGRVLQKKHF